MGFSTQFFVFFLSVLLHVGVVGIGLLQLSFSKPVHVRLDRPMVYHVDLVNLAPPAPGPPAAAQPTPPAPPAAAAQEQPKPAPTPPKPAPTPPPPQPKAEVKIPEQPKPTPAPPKPEPKPEPPKPAPTPAPAPKTPPPPAQPKKPEPSREQILAEALGAAQKDAAQRSRPDEREQALASLRQEGASGAGGAGGEAGGTAAGGLVEVYAQIVESRIKAQWRYPKVGARQDLSAVVEIRLDRNGRVLGSRVVRSSGRPDFDASTERAVEETGQLPPPPRADLLTILITFNLQEL